MRQVNRLHEPEELKALRRFKDMGAAFCRSTYGLNGRIGWEIGFPSASLPKGGIQPADGGVATTWVDMMSAEVGLSAWKAEEERATALRRREARLPADRSSAAWADLSAEEKELLLLSNAKFAARSFRSGKTETPSQESGGEKTPTK
jgi:hypothetical protein